MVLMPGSSIRRKVWGRDWVLHTQSECLETEPEVVTFLKKRGIYFRSEREAFWDPPVGVAALTEKRGVWYYDLRKTCDIKSSMIIFQKNIDFYKEVIPKIQSSTCSLVEFKIKLMDIYWGDK